MIAVLVLVAFAIGTVGAFVAWPTDGMRCFADRLRRLVGLSPRLPVVVSAGILAGWTIHTSVRPVIRKCQKASRLWS